MHYEPIIKITWPLRWMIEHFSELRNQKQKVFKTSTYGEKRSPKEAHDIGLYGEIAVAHYFDVPIDINIYNKGDNGTDLLIEKFLVSVKTTTHWNDPWLRVEKEHFLEDHIYICAALDSVGNRVKLVGFANSETVKKSSLSKLVEGGPLDYIVKRSSLRDLPRRKSG